MRVVRGMVVISLSILAISSCAGRGDKAASEDTTAPVINQVQLEQALSVIPNDSASLENALLTRYVSENIDDAQRWF